MQINSNKSIHYQHFICSFLYLCKRVHLLRRDVPHGEGYVSVNQHMSHYGKVKMQDKEFFL